MNNAFPTLRGRPLAASPRANVAVTLCTTLLAASLWTSTATASVFIWENNFADDAPINGTNFLVDGVNLSFTQTVFSDNDFGTFDLFLNPPDHADYITFDAGEQGGQTGYAQFYLNNQNDDPADYIELLMSFSSPVTALSFLLVDVDSGPDGTPEWDDMVEIFVNGNTNIRSLAPLVHSFVSPPATASVINDDEAGVFGFEGFNGRDADTDETFGNISLDFGALPVSSVRIRYFSTNDAQSNPINQWVGVSDLTFTVPEPSAAFLLTAAMIGSLLRRRRS
ncbi:MAG: PEP-CTERM sorting domain-containing protein [Verrucomicrobiota bacterium]